MEFSTMNQKLKESEQLRKELHEANSTLRVKIEKSHEDHVDVLDRLLSIQWQENETYTGMQAGKDYHAFVLRIEQFIFSYLADEIESMEMMSNPDPPSYLVEELFKYIPTPGREAFQLPYTDLKNVMAAIINFVHINVLSLDFYCPNVESIGFLKTIEDSVKKNRKFIAWRTWRNVTFTAITKRPAFATEREEQAKEMTKYLSSMLEIFLPVSKSRKLREAVRRMIIEPAFQLAHNMHLSINEFSMNYTKTFDDPGVCELALDQNPEVDCVNITGSTVKFPTEDGRVVKYMFDEAPELRWSVAKADGPTPPEVFRRSKVVVYDPERIKFEDKPVPKGRHPTLLAWLEAKVDAKSGR